jgi:hypothetical protein
MDQDNAHHTSVLGEDDDMDDQKHGIAQMATSPSSTTEGSRGKSMSIADRYFSKRGGLRARSTNVQQSDVSGDHNHAQSLAGCQSTKITRCE